MAGLLRVLRFLGLVGLHFGERASRYLHCLRIHVRGECHHLFLQHTRAFVRIEEIGKGQGGLNRSYFVRLRKQSNEKEEFMLPFRYYLKLYEKEEFYFIFVHTPYNF